MTFSWFCLEFHGFSSFFFIFLRFFSKKYRFSWPPPVSGSFGDFGDGFGRPFLRFQATGGPLRVSVFVRLLQKRAPPDLGFGRGFYKRKNERFFPPRQCQGGALLFSPCYRGICPSDIKHAFLFQKCPRGSAIFFIFFKKKSHPSIGDFFYDKNENPPEEVPILVEKRGGAYTSSLG